jgi:hypothetical protein
MHVDSQGQRAMRTVIDRSARRARRPWLQLLAELMAQAEERAALIRHRETPWASVTFTGTRHRVTVAFTGAEAIVAGERFIAALPDHEFSIPGQLVADASVAAVDHALHPQPRLTVECEVLLLEEV